MYFLALGSDAGINALPLAFPSSFWQELYLVLLALNWCWSSDFLHCIHQKILRANYFRQDLCPDYMKSLVTLFLYSSFVLTFLNVRVTLWPIYSELIASHVSLRFPNSIRLVVSDLNLVESHGLPLKIVWRDFCCFRKPPAIPEHKFLNICIYVSSLPLGPELNYPLIRPH